MTPSDWSNVRDLFERALDEGQADAIAWLDQQSGVDPRLRAEVLSLLQHHERAGGFLNEPPAVRSEPPDDPPLAAGRVLGPYTIVREAGRGGMGRVYVATDARLERTVALKAVRRLPDPAQRERLRREARAAATLTHPGICTVYALEELEGDLFIASEFVEGRTLRQEIVNRDRPTAVEALALAQEVAGALAAAHRAGIVHGDLKPENVMRGYDGRLKILDFGLARAEPAPLALDPDPDTQAGAGTPGYMAPEQLNGRGRDARADVFAFGVLMYQLHVTGTHPFTAPTPFEMATRVLESEPTPLVDVRPDLPPGLRTLIERCLRKAAADRFSTAAEIAMALASDDHLPRTRTLAWWRAHQLIVVALYGVASIVAWQIKELNEGQTTTVFLIVGVAATVGAVFRGHLLFTERVNRPRLKAERRGAAPFTMGVDVLIAAVMAIDGVTLASRAPLAAVLTIGLSAGLVLARVVLEPSTTSAAFVGP